MKKIQEIIKKIAQNEGVKKCLSVVSEVFESTKTKFLALPRIAHLVLGTGVVLAVFFVLWLSGERTYIIEGEELEPGYIRLRTEKSSHDAKRMKMGCSDSGCYFITSNYTEAEKDKANSEGKPVGYAYGLSGQLSDFADLSRTIRGMAEKRRTGKITLSRNVSGYFYTEFSTTPKDAHCDSNLTVSVHEHGLMLVTTSCRYSLLGHVEDGLLFPLHSANHVANLLDKLISEVK